MNLRLPVIGAIAVVLASLSLSAVLQGNGWLGAGIGAVIVVAAAGLGTRAARPRAAVIATAVVLPGVVPLLLWRGWPTLVAGLVIVGLTAASATGARTLRGFAVLACYLAALLIYLNLVFATGPSYGHLIPSHASMSQLGAMVQAAFDQFRSSPPVPDTRPVSLVGAGGIGLVAIMVDLLAVRLRRPAVAGLPLLVLFSVPVASNLKSFGALQVLTFAIGMAGFLTLLSTASRERLRLWGQLVTFRYVQRTDETGSGPDTKDLAASGRRIGLAAVCLAVIIPVVLPSMRAHDLFSSGGTGAGHAASGGGGGGAVLDAMLQVQNQLQEKRPRPVFTYTTTAANPGDQYFQVYVLNYHVGDNNWLPQLTLASQRPVGDQALPYAPPGQEASTPAVTIRTTVTLNKDQGQTGQAGFLPVPYAPVKLKAATPGWAELPGSLMLYNPAEPMGGLRYTVTSSEADPTPAQIEDATQQVPNSIMNQYGSYNGGPDYSRLAAIAHQHTASAVTPLQAALDLQKWLTSKSFTYSLKPGLPDSSHWLLTFLTTDRRGYCQQFAWAFAVLARIMGIPSRIAVGYTGGSPRPHGTSWQVTTADAHAWPELYFAGIGWLRFEPTPHGATGQGTATAPLYATGSGAGKPATSAAGKTTGAGSAGGASQAGNPGLNRFTHGQPGGVAASGRVSGSSLWPAIAIPILALLLIGSPAVVRRLTRRRRWLLATGDVALAGAAWQELTDDLADYDLGCSPGETPRALARRLTRDAHLDGAATEALGRIVAAAERAQYATLARPGAGLAADVAHVRRAVAATVPVRRRIRARLLPASTLTDVQGALQRAGDMLSWLDTSFPALRRQAR